MKHRKLIAAFSAVAVMSSTTAIQFGQSVFADAASGKNVVLAKYDMSYNKAEDGTITLKDVSGNGFDMTCHGIDENSFTRQGIRYVLNMDGADDYMDIPAGIIKDDSVALEIEYYPETSVSDKNKQPWLIDLGSTTDDNISINGYGSDKKCSVAYRVDKSSNTASSFSVNTAYTTVTTEFNGTELTVYKDHEKQATVDMGKTVTDIIGDGATGMVGKSLWGDRFYDGKIKSITFYDNYEAPQYDEPAADSILNTIEMYDYGKSWTPYNSSYLLFYNGGLINEKYGTYNGPNLIRPGIVLDTLDEDGNVVLRNDENDDSVQLTVKGAQDGKLFQPEQSKGTYEMAFNYIGKGRYSFDSNQYKITANSETGVLEYSEYADGDDKGFFPLDTDEGHNYYFGSVITLPFVYRDGGKVGNGDDMFFEFSGDDDVWVFIDGKLALDLGGIHGRMEGAVNFASQSSSSYGKLSSSDIARTETVKDLTDIIGSWTDDSEHEVKVFYLERGAGESNFKMTFNLLQRTSYTVKYFDGTGSNAADPKLITSVLNSKNSNGEQIYAGEEIKKGDIKLNVNDETAKLLEGGKVNGWVTDKTFDKEYDSDSDVVATVADDGSTVVYVIFRDKPTPTASPNPSTSPTADPTSTPSTSPTADPTSTPSTSPTADPTSTPSANPTAEPTPTSNNHGGGSSTPKPTATATAAPTATATTEATAAPTATATTEATAVPTATATAEVTAAPTATATAEATATPAATKKPSRGHGGGGSSSRATATPTVTATAAPTAAATAEATASPSAPSDNVTPTSAPTAAPSIDNNSHGGGSTTPTDTNGTDSSGSNDSYNNGSNINSSTEPDTTDTNGSEINSNDSAHEYKLGPDQGETPKTGDTERIALWTLAMAVFAVGGVYSMKKARKRESR